jgi:hypothetical protein
MQIGLGELVDPTHRGEAAMNGARRGLGMEDGRVRVAADPLTA